MQVDEQLLNIRVMLLHLGTETNSREQIGRELKVSLTGGDGKSGGQCDASSERRRLVVLLLNFHGDVKEAWTHVGTDGSF